MSEAADPDHWAKVAHKAHSDFARANFWDDRPTMLWSYLSKREKNVYRLAADAVVVAVRMQVAQQSFARHAAECSRAMFDVTSGSFDCQQVPR